MSKGTQEKIKAHGLHRLSSFIEWTKEIILTEPSVETRSALAFNFVALMKSKGIEFDYQSFVRECIAKRE